MNIIGPDELVFGVDDVAAMHANTFWTTVAAHTRSGGDSGRFEALDGTAVVISRASDPKLPAAPGPACVAARNDLWRR